MSERDDLRRYLELRLRECEARPDLCAHSIAAYQAALANVAAVGDMFAIAQADSLDRYANFARLYEALGDARKVRANQLRFDAAKSARSHRELVEKLTAANDAASPLEEASNRLRLVVDQLLELVVPLATGTAKQKSDAKASVTRLVAEARSIDASFALSAFRSRVPWDDDGFGNVQRILGVR